MAAIGNKNETEAHGLQRRIHKRAGKRMIFEKNPSLTVLTWILNLFTYHEPLVFAIISFILMTLMFKSAVILKGKIRCHSLVRVKELNNLI